MATLVKKHGYDEYGIISEWTLRNMKRKVKSERCMTQATIGACDLSVSQSFLD